MEMNWITGEIVGSLDYDSDGVLNLLDSDSDGDGVIDGIEISDGYDPSTDPLECKRYGVHRA